jgi:hypothetical protein
MTALADRSTLLSLTTALLASGALLVGGHTTTAAPHDPIQPLTPAIAWPDAAHADLPNLHSTPLDFLDAHTAIGTLPTRDGTYLRLVVENRALRDLTRLKTAENPQFSAITAIGSDIVWAQTTTGHPWQIWHANRHHGPARPLVEDAGDMLLGGGQYDLVGHAGRVYWAEAGDDRYTGIRSVPLHGGPIEQHDEPGQWALSSWPWLTGNAGPVRLRDIGTGREIRFRAAGGHVDSCTPRWCRILTLAPGGDLERVDLMHPDGSSRRPVAGPGARAAVPDIAVGGRFEIFSEPGAFSDLTGEAALVVYDIADDRTVRITPEAGDVATHDGVLWWSTGQDDLIWHTLELPVQK